MGLARKDTLVAPLAPVPVAAWLAIPLSPAWAVLRVLAMALRQMLLSFRVSRFRRSTARCPKATRWRLLVIPHEGLRFPHPRAVLNRQVPRVALPLPLLVPLPREVLVPRLLALLVCVLPLLLLMVQCRVLQAPCRRSHVPARIQHFRRRVPLIRSR